MTRRWARVLTLGALLLAPRAARAQDTTQAAPPPPADTATVPRALPVNGLLLRPQHLRYQMRIVTPDSSHVVGDRDVDVRQGTYGGFPAWVVAETRGGAVRSSDSLYLSYVDLRPLHWTSMIGGQARLALEFTADSVYGGTSGPTGARTIVLAHGRDLLTGAAMTDVAFELMPHTVGRVDSVSVLVIDLGASRVLPGTVSVDGEQDVETPTGRVHCWVVRLSTAEGEVQYWVSELDPTVVRTRQTLPGHPDSTFEETLLSRQ